MDEAGRSVVGQVKKPDCSFQRKVCSKDRFYTFCKWTKKDGHTSAICAWVSRAFFGMYDSQILVKSLHTHKQVSVVRNVHKTSRVNSLAVDKKGRFLFSGGSNKKMVILDLRQKHCPVLREFEFGSDVIHLRLSPDQNRLLVGGFAKENDRLLHIVEVGELINGNS